MAYKIKWLAEGVLWTFHGTLSSEDAIQANLDIYGDSRFDDLRYQIVDISKVEQFKATEEAMTETAAMDEAASLNNPRLIIAVVAKKVEAIKIAELYKSAMKNSPWEVAIFDSMDESEKWVNSFK